MIKKTDETFRLDKEPWSFKLYYDQEQGTASVYVLNSERYSYTSALNIKVEDIPALVNGLLEISDFMREKEAKK